MHFTSIITAAVLASTTFAAPTSNLARRDSTTPALTLTQQLSLVELAADRYTLLPNDTQFIYDFGNPALKGKGGKGGDLIPANRKIFPALVGAGMGMAVGFLNGCGFNTPHAHPRATELQFVIQGRLVTEMVPENNVFRDNNSTKGRRVVTNTVQQYQMTPFYQGSVHTQFNPDCTPAAFVAAFNNEDFGTGQITDELFALSDDVLGAAFGQAIDGKDIDTYRAAIPATIAKGVEDCLSRCGLSKV